MTYEEIVEKVRDAFGDADLGEMKDHISMQFNVTGEGEGAFYLEITEGKVKVEPYEYYDRDVLVVTPADALLEIAEGKLDPVLAFTTGRIHAEGDLGKAAFLKELVKQKKKEAKKEAKEEKAAAKAAEKADAKTEAKPAKTEGKPARRPGRPKKSQTKRGK